MFDFEGQSAREVSSPYIHWCYMLPLLQLLHLLQVCSVQQVKTELHFGLFDHNSQSLFCGVSLINDNITTIFEMSAICTRLVNNRPSCFISLAYKNKEVTSKRSKIYIMFLCWGIICSTHLKVTCCICTGNPINNYSSFNYITSAVLIREEWYYFICIWPIWSHLYSTLCHSKMLWVVVTEHKWTNAYIYTDDMFVPSV